MIQNTKIAAICVAEMQNDDIQSILYPLNEALSETGWRMIVFNSCTDFYLDNDFNEGESHVFELLNHNYIDAVLILSRTIKSSRIQEQIIRTAKDHGTPVIMIDSDTDPEGTIQISFDESDAFEQLVLHLVEHHHFTRINCIAGFRDNPISEKRLAIFRRILAEHGIPFHEDQLGYGNFYAEPTREVMNRFLQQTELPEAIVCINDSMAITVCDILSENNIAIPEQITVTGFDGIEQEKCNYPRITTCRRDMDSFARYVRNILEQITETSSHETHYSFPYTFDPSESCGCRQCQMLNINRSINTLYAQMNDSVNYNRSMNNMNAKMTNLKHINDLHIISRYYIPFEGYICTNADFNLTDHASSGMHTAFAPIMDAKFCFDDTNFDQSIPIRSEELIPDWTGFFAQPAPLVISCLHHQQDIYGYTAVFADRSKYQGYGYGLHRLQRFVINLNNCIGMYLQKNDLQASNRKLRDVQNKIIVSFADLVESRDSCTGQHIKRTSEYLKILVQYMATLPQYQDILTDNFQALMYKAAPLHDIGKIKVSDVILNKPGRLDNDEFEKIKCHALEGSEIIRDTLTNIEDNDYLQIAHDMALFHHEKWDGSGYPCHLHGDEIPLCARIMAIVDVFDALTSKRIYKEAYTADRAFRILEESGGTHFDPDVLSAFLAIRPEIEKALYKNHNAEA